MDATINSNLEINENAGAVGLVSPPRSAVRSEMNEEQPIFKVTDRRLFNTDGSPRDVPPEEKPEPRGAEPEVAAAVPMDAAPQVSTTGSIAAETQPQSATAAGREFEQAEEGAQAELGEEDIVGAKDPASFVNFIMSIASNAASSLGMMEHPVTHKREVDIELGKHWIDVLGMLQKKTRGNLAPQEQEMLEGLLADLRMQYVSLTSSPPKSARTFSGSDITGGR
jgi:hypothetical protein